MGWLADAIAACTLTEEVEGYLLGRGAQPETIQALGCVTWRSLAEPVNDPSWKAREYGKEGRGERLDGKLIVPLRSPRGDILGFEARTPNRQVKEVTRYLVPEAKWNPVWFGMHSGSMGRVWAGGDVWLCEGHFDLFPLEWAVPTQDSVLACGTARVSGKQVEFLRRFAKGWVHVVLDNDEPGRKGAHGWVDETGKRHWGALDALKHAGVKSRAFPYRGGKDPGEIWDRTGVQGVQAAFRG